MAIYKTPFGKKMAVTYSTDKGSYKLTVPTDVSLVIHLSGSSLSPTEFKFNTGDGSNATIEKNFTMTEGIDTLDIGSFDHVQLYLSQIQKQSIEDSIINGKTAELNDLIPHLFIDPRQKSWAHLFAGHLLYALGKDKEAVHQFAQSGTNWHGNLRGDEACQSGRYEEALSWYSQSESRLNRAIQLKEMARHFNRQYQMKERDKCYELSWTDYKNLLGSQLYPWDPSINKTFSDLYESEWAKAHVLLPPETELAKLLHMAAYYCQQLEKRSIYYFCTEDKTDHILINQTLFKGERNPVSYFQNIAMPVHDLAKEFKPVTIRCKYDIQLIQNDDGSIDEKRRPSTKYVYPHTALKHLESYEIHKAHFGPNTIIGAEVQGHYIYRITGYETLFGIETTIVEAIPKRIGITPIYLGKAWINKLDGSILKIERLYQGTENRINMRRRALLLDLNPQLIFISEYGLEKNGFRYLSRNHLQEIYQRKEEQELIRLDVESIYKDYQFFNVGTRFIIKSENQ